MFGTKIQLLRTKTQAAFELIQQWRNFKDIQISMFLTKSAASVFKYAFFKTSFSFLARRRPLVHDGRESIVKPDAALVPTGLVLGSPELIFTKALLIANWLPPFNCLFPQTAPRFQAKITVSKRLNFLFNLVRMSIVMSRAVSRDVLLFITTIYSLRTTTFEANTRLKKTGTFYLAASKLTQVIH